MTEIMKQDIDRITRFPLPWEKLAGKKVLVTGATGFIGSFLVRALLARPDDIRVIAMARDGEKARKLFGESDRLSLLTGDVTQPVEGKVRADYIIHCASNAAPDLYAKDPVGTMRTNFLGTGNLLDLAKRCGCEKFLYVSTIEVYGKTNQTDPIREDDFGWISSTNVRSCYPESKKCSENLAVCYGSQYGIQVVIGRLSYIYGAGMSRNDSKICAEIVRNVAAGKDVVLKTPGTQRRSYTYITDAVTGLLTVLLEGEPGQAYNIASPEPVTIADLARLCCGLFPETGVRVRFDMPDGQESFSFIGDAVLDSGRLENLGWYSEVTPEEGLRRAVIDGQSE